MAHKRTSNEFKPSLRSAESTQKKNEYMKEYVRKKRTSSQFKPSVHSAESTQKKNEYMKQYMRKKNEQAQNFSLLWLRKKGINI